MRESPAFLMFHHTEQVVGRTMQQRNQRLFGQNLDMILFHIQSQSRLVWYLYEKLLRNIYITLKRRIKNLQILITVE